MEEKKNYLAKILLCEDDESLGGLLGEYLAAKDYEVVLKTDGLQGLKAFKSDKFDICVFDVMMPIMDGFTLASSVREIDANIPILFLTAKTLKDDILEGFKRGADDYITKPFSMEELLLRITAILRRSGGVKKQENLVYSFGSFTYDTHTQELMSNGALVKKLTTKEHELLSLLCSKGNDILERTQALKSIWIDDSAFNARSMDVYITKLRKIVEADPDVKLLNVHGKGYKLVFPEQKED